MLVGLIATTSPVDRPDGPCDSSGRQLDLGLFGMRLFLASLAALFAPLLIYCLILRSQSTTWPPPGVPPLPAGFWLSTAILLALSVALSRGLSAIRHGGSVGLQRYFLIALLLAIFFLVVQSACWAQYLSVTVSEQNWRFAAFLYFFMLIHALHVVGGVAPLVVVLLNNQRGRYSSHHSAGVRDCAMYWHFLDGVWLVMFAAMVVPA